MANQRVISWVLGTAVLVMGSAAGATVLITVEEALALAFPGVTAVRETLFLSQEQRTKVQDTSGGEIKSGLATRYVARNAAGGVVGFAYLDTHVVRTLPETVMIVIDADGRVRRVEVVAFREPMEYLPRDSWYGQYEDKKLDPELELKRGIRPVTGATLTARATTDAVRRVLAIHEVAGKAEEP